MKFFTKAAFLHKSEPTGIAIKLVNGYTTAKNEDEARGLYYKQLRENWPEYNVRDMIFLEVTMETLDKIKELLQEIKDV
jgi:hypothetical protein